MVLDRRSLLHLVHDLLDGIFFLSVLCSLVTICYPSHVLSIPLISSFLSLSFSLTRPLTSLFAAYTCPRTFFSLCLDFWFSWTFVTCCVDIVRFLVVVVVGTFVCIFCKDRLFCTTWMYRCIYPFYDWIMIGIGIDTTKIKQAKKHYLVLQWSPPSRPRRY